LESLIYKGAEAQEGPAKGPGAAGKVPVNGSGKWSV